MKSCCCFNLRTGGVIIGYLGVFGITILLLAQVFITALHVDDMTNEILATIIVSIIVLVASLVIEVFWIAGIKQNNDRMMMPSLVLSILAIIGTVYGVIGAFLAIIAALAMPKHSGYDKNDVGFLITIAKVNLVFYLFLAVLIPYFTAVKYYLYKEIKERNQNLPPTNVVPAGENGMVYKFSA